MSDETTKAEGTEGDPELDAIVSEIFLIIPSYYHEGQAKQIKQLISDYAARKHDAGSKSVLHLTIRRGLPATFWNSLGLGK